MYSSTNPPSPESNKPSAPELRQDPVTGQWVVIAVDRAHRPHGCVASVEPPRSDHCPFCQGHEQETPPSVASYPPPGGATRPEDWQLRVVPNLYPALLPNAPWQPPDGLLTTAIPARGWHEVVIESPRHLRRMTELTADEAELVLRAYRDRFRVYATDPCIACGIAFKNCGREAGMSQDHIHSQLVALPFIPPVLELELLGAQRFRARSGQCVFCDLAESEQRQRIRLVSQTEHFLAICPYAGRAPYETWVLPRHHWARFDQTPTTVLAELAQLLQDVLRQLEDALLQPAYNYVLHSCPFDTKWEDHYHWHFEIIPRIAHLAGLEWGTGVHVNIVSPEMAAQTLRKSERP